MSSCCARNTTLPGGRGRHKLQGLANCLESQVIILGVHGDGGCECVSVCMCTCVCVLRVCVYVCMAARMGEILWLDMLRGCMCVRVGRCTGDRGCVCVCMCGWAV